MIAILSAVEKNYTSASQGFDKSVNLKLPGITIGAVSHYS